MLLQNGPVGPTLIVCVTIVLCRGLGDQWSQSGVNLTMIYTSIKTYVLGSH